MSIKKLQIIHTNDLHSQLDQWPSVVSKVKKLREDGENKGEPVFLFDIGDHADRVHPVTEGLIGKGNVELLNALGYDAVTIGNNEGMTFSKPQLDRLYEEASFSVLVGNLYEQDGSIPTWAKKHQIYTTEDQIKVGVFGITVPYYLFYKALGWKIKDPFEIIRQEIEVLRDEVDVLVCLSHLGLHEDERIANEFSEIDIILGSHTHHLLDGGKKINETWVHQCGRSGKYIGHISLSFDSETHHMTSVDIETIKTPNDAGSQDEETVEMLKQMEVRSEDVLNEVIATLPEDWKVNWEYSTPLTKLLVSGLRRWCGAEIGMLNSGVILEGLAKGPVTKGQLHKICPHPINPAKVALSGERLLEFIRQAEKDEMIYKKVKGFGFRGKILGSMVYDGIDILESTGPLQPEHVLIRGESLDRERTYEVATVDMFTFGHLYPSISTLKDKTYFMPEFLRDVLAWSLKNESFK
ncbi:bifunctional metallophosphatase/5'-nucleotidase [Alteribacter populi]|uniref:bifunctional metallophosphatase/5'-nucleotidase n=1 Tax=Alteribacter populi TaxID=2011011 RepID=UPI000BBABE66|nr:bifunctional UDP-sugar hydrolase/5'-nucleotidase [Alteribacter populi]